MKDQKDTQTQDAFKRGPGRPRKYDSAADRQRAYRQRKENETVHHDEITEALMGMAKNAMKAARECQEEKLFYLAERREGEALGYYMAWYRLVEDRSEHDENVFKAIIGWE